MTPNAVSYQMYAFLKSSRPAEKVVVRGSRSERCKRGALFVFATAPREGVGHEGQSRESLDRRSTGEHDCYLGRY